jgi:hypothetical protein
MTDLLKVKEIGNELWSQMEKAMKRDLRNNTTFRAKWRDEHNYNFYVKQVYLRDE